MSIPPAANSTSAMSVAQALQRAHAHWNAGQADQAEQLCRRVLAEWPGQADALHFLGLMAHAYGDLDLAIEHVREACLAPRAPATWYPTVRLYRQRVRGDWTGVIAEMAQSLAAFIRS